MPGSRREFLMTSCAVLLGSSQASGEQQGEAGAADPGGRRWCSTWNSTGLWHCAGRRTCRERRDVRDSGEARSDRAHRT